MVGVAGVPRGPLQDPALLRQRLPHPLVVRAMGSPGWVPLSETGPPDGVVSCRGDEWGAAGGDNCYGETEPIAGEGHRGRGTDAEMMAATEAAVAALSARGVAVQLLNITQLSELRKDGHPSIYRKQWEPLTENQMAEPRSFADCIHWCLPGVPDVWNEILYAHIFF